jgi:hypothetical protein
MPRREAFGFPCSKCIPRSQDSSLLEKPCFYHLPTQVLESPIEDSRTGGDPSPRGIAATRPPQPRAPSLRGSRHLELLGVRFPELKRGEKPNSYRVAISSSEAKPLSEALLLLRQKPEKSPRSVQPCPRVPTSATSRVMGSAWKDALLLYGAARHGDGFLKSAWPLIQQRVGGNALCLKIPTVAHVHVSCGS